MISRSVIQTISAKRQFVANFGLNTFLETEIPQELFEEIQKLTEEELAENLHLLNIDQILPLTTRKRLQKAPQKPDKLTTGSLVGLISHGIDSHGCFMLKSLRVTESHECTAAARVDKK